MSTTNASTAPVSVVMPVYNGERFLRPAIESILRQTHANLEFIIVNDGSMDASREIILSYRDPRIRFLELPEHAGLTKSLNHGLREARHEFIARHDCDDIAHPDRLAKQAAYLEAHPEVVLLGTQGRIIDSQDRSRILWFERIKGGVFVNAPISLLGIQWRMLMSNPFLHPSVVYRRSVIWDELGGYDESSLTEDAELWSRVAAKHPCSNLPEALCDHRYHADSVSSNRSDRDRECFMEVRRRNIAAFLKCPAADFEDWLRIHAWRHYGSSISAFGGDAGRRLLTGFRRLYDRFVEVNPSAPNHEEVQALVAGDFAHLATHLADGYRGDALEALWFSCRRCAPTAVCQLPKFGASFLMGRTARRAAAFLRGSF